MYSDTRTHTHSHTSIPTHTYSLSTSRFSRIFYTTKLLKEAVTQQGRVTWMCVPPLLPRRHFRAECEQAFWACCWGLGCVDHQRGRGLDNARVQTPGHVWTECWCLTFIYIRGAQMSTLEHGVRDWRKERAHHLVSAVGTSWLLCRGARCQRKGSVQEMTSSLCRS